MTRRQRTVFGEVANTYDDVRASYPDEAIARVITATALERGGNVLDVGCGTGILSEPFVERGHNVLGIDPSSEMARVARRKFAGNSRFRLHLVDFQAWSPGREQFDLVVAGQSWHWMEPHTRFDGAAAALGDTGHLALFWNAPVVTSTPLRSAIDAVYRRHVPDVQMGPPGSKSGLDGSDPASEIAASGRFSLLDSVEVPWERTYDADSYLKLLSTQSDHRLLDDDVLSQLFEGVAAAIDDAGRGSITVPYVCRAYIAALTSRAR